MTDSLKLWTTTPGGPWNHAYPIGNGRLGAMVAGGVLHNTKNNDTLQLNVDTLWWRSESDRHNPDALDGFREGRRLLLEGKVKEAEHLVKMTMTSCPKEQPPYLPLGNLAFVYENHYRNSDLQDYRRELDLDTGIVRVTYALDGVRYEREIFASAPDGVIVVRITTDTPGALSFYADLVRRPFSGPSSRVDDRTIQLAGSAGPVGVRYAAQARIAVTGGACGTRGDFVYAKGVDEAVLLVAGNTDYWGDDPVEACRRELNAASQKTYDQLKADHVADHAALFGRVSLDLPTPDDAALLPTPERLELVKDGADDPGLVALTFQFGRYLLIASSRPGTLPANLQGIWNKDFLPPWESKYTININAEMNY
ncbi:glycoside hydrolase family 95 protein, partial [bacterium]|nr:glycoside hydrolase family 95 protein [bacterium]